MYDLIVFIGRFQPFHNSHLEIMRRAYALTNNLLVVVGSSFQPPTYKNPFTDAGALVSRAYEENLSRENRNLFIEPQRDIYGDTKWCKQVQEKVFRVSQEIEPFGGKLRVGIIGCNKDETTYYLNLFPQWELIEVPVLSDLSATKVRETYFSANPDMEFLREVLPTCIYKVMDVNKSSPWRSEIMKEMEANEKYKSAYASLPYPPIFVTVDAVVIQSGHILMVKRRAYPGKGLLALPGGFLNAYTDPSIEDAMIRELREETKLKVPSPVLKGSIKNVKVFDAVNRSTRGRTITHAFNIVLSDGELPKVKGSSDAEKAFWMPLGELNSKDCFEDHYQIIEFFS